MSLPQMLGPTPVGSNFDHLSLHVIIPIDDVSMNSQIDFIRLENYGQAYSSKLGCTAFFWDHKPT